MAKKHGIPLRGRGGPSHAESLAPSADLPLPLAVAMAGQGGCDRVRRFQVLARSSSIRQAAMRLGCNDVTLFSQLTRLESDCGAPLLIRYTRTHRRQQLTPLGQGLLDQADDRLGRPSLVLLANVPKWVATICQSAEHVGHSWIGPPGPSKEFETSCRLLTTLLTRNLTDDGTIAGNAPRFS